MGRDLRVGYWYQETNILQKPVDINVQKDYERSKRYTHWIATARTNFVVKNEITEIAGNCRPTACLNNVQTVQKLPQPIPLGPL